MGSMQVHTKGHSCTPSLKNQQTFFLICCWLCHLLHFIQALGVKSSKPKNLLQRDQAICSQDWLISKSWGHRDFGNDVIHSRLIMHRSDGMTPRKTMNLECLACSKNPAVPSPQNLSSQRKDKDTRPTHSWPFVTLLPSCPDVYKHCIPSIISPPINLTHR